MAEASNPNSKPVSTMYRNMGGVNEKSSEYSLEKTQFLRLSNFDFDVPNALSKRPGSTQAITSGTSGPITSLFEYQRLDGLSAVVAGSDTAMFYIASAGLTLMDTGWTSGQPTDMLTFVNKLWLANGQNFKSWSGPGLNPAPVGLPCPQTALFHAYMPYDFFEGVSGYVIGGFTSLHTPGSGSSAIVGGLYMAYSYVRNDGYIGPCDLMSFAKCVNPTNPNSTSIDEVFFSGFTVQIGGVTIPSGYGISGIAVWVAVDKIGPIAPGASLVDIPVIGRKSAGNMGWLDFPFGGFSQGVASPYQGASTGSYAGFRFLSVTLRPGADLSRFWLYTTIPGSSLFLTNSNVPANNQFINGVQTSTFWSFPFQFAGPFLGLTTYPNFNNYTGPASGAGAFTGMPFCWFNTNTPKYIEVNQNSMFSSGFSQAPSVIWFSELGQPENIQPENNIEVRTNDGDRIYSIRAFNNQVLVMKQYSFHKIIGDSPENYELVEISLEYGCISDKTVCEYREKLVWLDQKGILEFNGSSWDIISTPVEDTFRRMNLAAAKEKAVAVHQIYRNQIWWGIPVDGSTQNNLTVVFDYLVGAWTFFEGFNPSSFAMVQSNLTKPTAWRGNYSGMIYYHGESFFGDNGQGITCLMRPHWDHLKENETWIWRRFFLDRGRAQGVTGQITGKLYADYDTSTVQATFSMYQSDFQTRAEFGVPAKAVTGDFAHFSASLPLLINGFTWARRYLRNV